MRKLPLRFGTVVMPLLLSILMTFIVSFISTLRGVGWTPDFVWTWLSAWGMSWLVAFPTTLVVLPLVRRAAASIIEAR